MSPELTELIFTIVVAGLGMLFAWLKNRDSKRAELYENLNLDIQAAVDETYQEYVKAIKEASADGKLTDEEKKHARDLAFATALKIGKSRGIDYGKKYAVPVIMSLIQTYVLKRKGDIV